MEANTKTDRFACFYKGVRTKQQARSGTYLTGLVHLPNL
ncbi:hypothetical protein FAES_5358 [Fibrella aestuarina BUZ 2]|uniref:Uncharacterized protein n=1 Tax=Fibrella aestuarina BUZ 2 TaxID=1166018 RepID=I0KGV4_9BACT|nr:hypothetical protein FAES_5358 [Fibrella aestuarina BUZ 2]